jgi:hypothetical protein
LKSSVSDLQDIESELDRELARRLEEVEHSLANRIDSEKEAARLRMEEIGREFDRERGALLEFRAQVSAAESERTDLGREMREHFNLACGYLAEIDRLTKLTVEEINRATDIQQRMEDLRRKTAERAGFLKRDLQEKFGIETDVSAEAGEGLLPVDLDAELEKLRRIKEILRLETPAAPAAEPGDSTAVPEIQDLVAGSEPEGGDPAAPEAVPVDPLEACRRTEPGNGHGELHSFQKGGRIVLDAERLLETAENARDEVRRLARLLDSAESPKEQFFIKQDIINGQESLRKLVLRAVKMCENKSCSLPAATAGVFDLRALKDLLERLSLENWSHAADFADFEKVLEELRADFAARATPPDAYRRAILEELEAE